MTAYFVEATDVLFFRGHKLYGESGSFGEALMPPQPTVIAGAVRAAILSRDRVPLDRFIAGEFEHEEAGSRDRAGRLRILSFQLARKTTTGIERLFPIPADLVLSEDDQKNLHVQILKPRAIDERLCSSYPLSQLPVLHQNERSKPVTGYWLREKGYRDYLQGKVPQVDHFIHSGELWKIDHRTGIHLDPQSRSAKEGMLFSTESIVFAEGVGFCFETNIELKDIQWLRLGGDGRSARLYPVELSGLEPDYERICQAKQARLVLQTQSIFEKGWPLPGMDEQGYWQLGPIKARVIAIAASRSEWSSGWDLALQKPKVAYRCLGAGSVYWLSDLEAEVSDLKFLQQQGLWTPQELQRPDKGLKRLEGFNQFQLAL